MNKCEHCGGHGVVQVLMGGEYIGSTRIVPRERDIGEYRYRYLSMIYCSCNEDEVVLVGALEHTAIIKSCSYPMPSTLPTQKLSEATRTLNTAI